MKQAHVILRSKMFAARDSFQGGLARADPMDFAIGGPDITVDVEDLAPSAVPGVTRGTDVVAVAPVVPMKLIAPMSTEAAPAATEVTWGVKAVGAHTSPFTGKGIVVAVLDTGIDAAHPAFAGVEIVQNDFTGEGNGDGHGHGTHCAGTIFGRSVAGQRIGVAPGVGKALVGKVLGEQGGGESPQIVSAIQWAVESGANVVSMSLGIDFPGLVRHLQEQGYPPELATSLALEGYRANVQLFERLAALVRTLGAFMQPTVIVAAAGNESRRNLDPKFEIAVSPPAVAEGIISVAALGQGTQGLTVAPFSNTGANVSGPGVGIVSAKPGGGLQMMSGTSMATPHVAGVIALWAEKIKGGGMLNAMNLTGRLVGSAVSDGFAPGFDPFDSGAGLVRAPQA